MILPRMARALKRQFKINPEAVTFDWWLYGLRVEEEHNRSYQDTAQIVIDHLKEYPDYYQRLDVLEKEAKLFWKGKQKPAITLIY